MVISLEGLGEPSGSPKIHTHNRLLSDRGSHNLSAIVLVRVFRGRNLWRQRKNALISNMQGRKLPALVLKDLQGNTVDLRAERGNVVLLNFFAAW